MKNPHRPALLLALLLAATLPVQAQTAVPAAPKVPAKPASAPELALKIEHDINIKADKEVETLLEKQNPPASAGG